MKFVNDKTVFRHNKIFCNTKYAYALLHLLRNCVYMDLHTNFLANNQGTSILIIAWKLPALRCGIYWGIIISHVVIN